VLAFASVRGTARAAGVGLATIVTMTLPTRAGAGPGRLHYAWIVAGVTFLALLSSAGIGATRAVLVLPLEREFGWDRATISLALSINLLLFGLCGPFTGAIMARFGVRRVMLTATADGRIFTPKISSSCRMDGNTLGLPRGT